MASPKVEQALGTIAKAADDKERVAGFESLLELDTFRTLSRPETAAADLRAVADALFDAPMSIMPTRAVLTSFAGLLKRLEMDEVVIAVARPTLERLSGSHAAAYVEQVAALREALASALEGQEEFREAAAVLAEIPLDSSQRKVSEAERVRVWIHIVRNYLEVDDTTSAETYLNKAKNVIYQVGDDRDLNLHFRLSQARIQDAKRAFLPASQLYHEISLSPAIAEEDRLRTLAMATKCAILAPAGPARSRALGRLYKDERASELAEFAMLEKMFFDRLLSPDEVAAFAEGLAPHQLATTSDGSTVLAKAVVEHNLLGASRLYANISFAALGRLLGLGPEKAEETTARMIEQGRLLGRIDQVEEYIWFEKGEASGERGSGRAEPAVAKEIRRWDANIESLSGEVEAVTNALQKEYPEFVAQHLLV